MIFKTNNKQERPKVVSLFSGSDCRGFVKPDGVSLGLISQASLEFNMPIGGYVFLVDQKVSLRFVALDAFGKPSVLDLGLRAALRLNPQTSRPPARIDIEFENSTAFGTVKDSIISGSGTVGGFDFSQSFGDIFSAFGEEEIGAQTTYVDLYGDPIEDDVQGETLFASGRAGKFFQGGKSLFFFNVAPDVRIKTWAYENYGAVDQPRAVIKGLKRGARIDAIFRVEDDQLNFGSSKKTHGSVVVVHDNRVLRENQLDVRLAGKSDTQRFDLDPYYKWSLFPARLSWYLKSWIRSGLFPNGVKDPFTNSVIISVYPRNHTHRIAGIFGGGRDIDPPLPQVTFAAGERHLNPAQRQQPNGFDGEQGGIDRPVYTHDMSRLDFRFVAKSSDTVHKNPALNFDEVSYKGGPGLEDYVKRVVSAEYWIDWTPPRGTLATLGGYERIRHGATIQAIAARSYVLAAWLNGRGKIENPIKSNYAPVTLKADASFQVHYLHKLNKLARNEDKRMAIEDAVHESWGQVLTYRGKIATTEYFAGDASGHQTVNGSQAYAKAIYTPYGIDADKLTGSGARDYKRKHGHGRGFSQIGSRLLAAQGLSYLQIAHWYFFGIHLRNGYGLGDFVSRIDYEAEVEDEHDWMVSRPTERITDYLIDAANAQNWRVNPHFLSDSTTGVISKTSDENWHLSHNFRAHEFCKDFEGNPRALSVSSDLSIKLQKLRFKCDQSISILGVSDDGQSIRVKLGSSTAVDDAKSIFGEMNVTILSGSNKVELSL